MKWNDINMENNTEEYVDDEKKIFSYEVKRYRNKNIHIRNRIFSEGTLIFNHCCIYYNEPGYNGAIFLIDGAKLKITNSIVICKGMNKNTFITGGGNNIIIDSVTFMDCAFFLRNRRCDFFSFKRCQIKNCYAEFINIDMAGRGRVSENVIFQEGLAEFYRNTISDKTVFEPELIRVDTGDFRFNISNNLVVEQESFRKNWAEDDDDKGIYYISTFGVSNVVNITSCKFVGITKGIIANSIRMQDCVFENCTNIVRGLQEESSVSNCRFLSCYGSLIESNFSFLDGSLAIESCQFINVNNASVDRYTKRFHPASITFGRVNTKDHNVMRNCNFYGAVLGNQYLIACRDTTEINELMTEIEGCTFRNCITSRSDGVIINTEDASVSGQKKLSAAQVIKVKNCTFMSDLDEEDARVI